MRSIYLFGFLTLALQLSACASKSQMVASSKDFDRIKALSGTWKGKSEMNGKPENVTVTYKVTSAGSAVVETLMPGKPHEMVSIYHANKGRIAMTHYCAIGNQPEMALIKTDDSALYFEMIKPVGISSMNEKHMHSVTLKLIDKNTLQQEWTHFEDGEKKGSAIFTFKKVNS